MNGTHEKNSQVWVSYANWLFPDLFVQITWKSKYSNSTIILCWVYSDPTPTVP